jgi:SAM-dependent methyltransferase
LLYEKFFPFTAQATILHHINRINAGKVLDVGCGKGENIKFLSNGWHFRGVLIGLDIYIPYLRKAKTSKIYNDVLLADANHLPFRISSFDAVLAFDLIEHLEKKQGLDFIRACEKISKGFIIIFTPVGYLRQEQYDGNPYQQHKSGYTPREFRSLGYEVYGVRGSKFLWKEGAKPKLKLVSELLSWITQLFTYLNPDLAYQMLCIKRARQSQS